MSLILITFISVSKNLAAREIWRLILPGNTFQAMAATESGQLWSSAQKMWIRLLARSTGNGEALDL
jgi:hypothetical protein